MKTTHYFEQRIKEERGILSKLDESDRKKIKKISADIRDLMWYQRYLETNPREGLLQDDLSRLQTRLNVIEDEFPNWIAERVKEDNKDVRKMLRSEYDKIMGVHGLKKKIETVKYLLA